MGFGRQRIFQGKGGRKAAINPSTSIRGRVGSRSKEGDELFDDTDKERELQASPETLESIQRTGGHGLVGGTKFSDSIKEGEDPQWLGGTSVSVWGSGTVKVWTSPDLKQDGFYPR